MFDRVLIANRGEIAVRIIRSCQSLGYSTVAVYSDADREALHVSLADQALCIGPGPAAQSYLAGDKLIAAAKASGAAAIHPGYGFLSERSDFAQAVQGAGLVFIGPDWQAIEAMGNKSSAKIRMLAAGVRCVPGYQGDAQSDASLLAEAIKIGLPVMVKAAAGGGGRGMRLVQEAADLPAAIQSARSESVNAFGDGQLLIEKAVLQARHVEIKCLATGMAIWCTSASATARCRGGIKTGGRVAQPGGRPSPACAHGGSCSGRCPGGGLRGCGHCGIFVGARRQLLFS